MDILTGFPGKFIEQLLLAGGQLGRCLHPHDDQLVTATVTLQNRYPLAVQYKYLAALGAGRNLQLDLAFKGRNFKFAAESRLGKGDRNLADEVVPLTLKDRMLLDGDHHVKVAWRATLGTRLTFTVHLQAVPRFYPSRDFQGKGLLAAGQAGAPAVAAWVGNLFAFTMAVRARAGQGEEALLEAHLAVAGTGAAGLGAGAGLGAAALAGLAAVVSGNLDLGFQAESGFLKGDGQVVAQVIATPPTATPAGSAAEDVAEDVAEDILERRAAKTT